MKSFKQFCAEVMYAGIDARSKYWASHSVLLGRQRASVETDLKAPIHASGKIAGLGEWVLYRTRADAADFVLVAYDLKQKAMVVATLFAAGASYKVYHLVSQAGSSIKAADMYAAFVRSGRMLRSDVQSEGGRRVWVKLSQMKGVTVYGWDREQKTPVNLGARWIRTFRTFTTNLSSTMMLMPRAHRVEVRIGRQLKSRWITTTTSKLLQLLRTRTFPSSSHGNDLFLPVPN